MNIMIIQQATWYIRTAGIRPFSRANFIKLQKHASVKEQLLHQFPRMHEQRLTTPQIPPSRLVFGLFTWVPSGLRRPTHHVRPPILWGISRRGYNLRVKAPTRRFCLDLVCKRRAKCVLICQPSSISGTGWVIRLTAGAR